MNLSASARVMHSIRRAGLAATLITCSLFALEPAPSGTMVGFLEYPQKGIVDNKRPSFAWIVNSTVANEMQSSYQILVTSSEALAAGNTGDIWNSGRVYSLDRVRTHPQRQFLKSAVQLLR